MFIAATMPPKKSLFSKPSWASASPGIESTSPSIFGNRVYEDILKVEKERKAEEQALARAELAAKAEAENAVLKETEEAFEGNTEPKQKRRRLSPDGEDRESEDKGNNSLHPDRTSPRSTHKESRSNLAKRSTPLRSSSTPSKRKRTPPSRPAIAISDDEEDSEMCEAPNARIQSQKSALILKPSSRRPRRPPSVQDSEDEDDEYTRDLKRKARERAENKANQPQRSSTQNQTKASTNIHDIGSPTSPSFDDKSFDQPPSTAPDPLLRIYIKPRIPKTKELIVTRHASQTLKIVKDAWCKRQTFDEAGASKVVLTWRGNRLWNSSTLQGVLRQLQKERPDEVFDVTNEGVAIDDNGVRKGGRITLEAMTEEQYDELLKEQEAKAEREARNAASGMMHHFSSSIPDSAQPTTTSNTTISPTHPHSITSNPTSKPPRELSSTSAPIITLLCRGRGPFQIRVRPSSTIDHVMRAYQKLRSDKNAEGEDAGKLPWLVFDGVRLERDKTIEECQLEDGDQVEVHWR